MFQQVLLFLIVTAASQPSLATPAQGQLSGNVGQCVKYPANTVITDFSPIGSILEGIAVSNGSLEVLTPGFYFIYAQAFFKNYSEAPELHNGVVLTVNRALLAQLQAGLGGKADYGSVYSGMMLYLQQGVYIGLETVYDSYLSMTWGHTFFGAFKISE